MCDRFLFQKTLRMFRLKKKKNNKIFDVKIQMTFLAMILGAYFMINGVDQYFFFRFRLFYSSKKREIFTMW